MERYLHLSQCNCLYPDTDVDICECQYAYWGECNDSCVHNLGISERVARDYGDNLTKKLVEMADHYEEMISI